MTDPQQPTWYDLLGVDPSADDAEIRAAWKAGIADLEPGDRRFETLNRGARVLLDPVARAEYDASLAAAAPEAQPEPQPEPQPESKPQPEPQWSVPAPVETGAEAERAEDGAPRRGVPLVPGWALAVLALLTAAAIGVTVWQWVEGDAASEEAVRAAQAAAEEAVVPVLSYDHRTLEEDQEAAQEYLTSDYEEEYDQLFAVIRENAPRTRTVVDVEVLASGIVRTGEGRVDVLVFVDRPTTNKLSQQPVVYRDQVTLSMQKVGDEWLVDDMRTTPASS